MDFSVKRKELLELWERMFRLCNALVTAAEKGEKELKASMVKELNGFLKLSKDILDHAEQQAEQDRLKALFIPQEEEEVEGEPGDDIAIQDEYDYQANRLAY